MSKCKKCGVTVMDDSSVCPLCDMVLTEDGMEKENSYPNVRKRTRLLRRLTNVVTYLSVVTEVLLIVINYYTYQGVKWSIITGAGMLYLIITLEYSVNKRNGHIKNIFVQLAAALLLLILIDFVLGYSGWSFNYGIPVVVLLMDAIIVICMIINLENWQSYLLMQIFALGVSGIQMVLYLCHVVKSPVITWTTLLTSAFLFSSCFFLGDKKARNELKRRFYI